jgi:FdhE protein
LATPIITDGTTDRVTPFPRVVLPAGDVFAARAQRLERLADGHAMGDYLRLLAALVNVQQQVLGRRQAAAVAPAQLQASRDYGMPPLSAQAHERSETWRDDLTDLIRILRPSTVNGVAATLDSLGGMSPDELEAMADRILAGTATDAEAACVPFVAAALQVYFTRLATSLDVDAVSRCDVTTICPVCATRPVASVIRIGGDRANLRYLLCALCSTEWHLTRVRCSSCEAEQGLQYFVVESAGRGPEHAPTRAEACDECKSYLKIFYQDKDAGVEPMADDLASLALDLLVDDRGYARSGPNLLLHPGSG